jgi:peptidoglycan hydrolase CwlO-like protein
MKKLFIISLILFGVICSIAVASSSNDNSLTKSNLKALQLEEEMNLPLHIPLPSLKPADKN